MKRSGLLFRHKPMNEEVVKLCFIKLIFSSDWSKKAAKKRMYFEEQRFFMHETTT